MSRLTLKISAETAFLLKVVASKKGISKPKYEDAICYLNSGKSDISTNPKYMEGYGLSRHERKSKGL